MNRRCLLLLLLFGVTALSLSSAVPIQSRPSGADSVHAARSPSLLETQAITTDAEQDAYDDDDGMSHEDDHFPDNFGNSSTASFVESEAFLTQFELPSSALCARTTHDWQYAQHDAFQGYMAQNRDSKNPPITPWTFSPGKLREHQAYANLQPRLVDECPMVALDPVDLRADPVFFGACCGSRGRYHCRRVLKGNPAEAALYAQLKAEWDKVKAKSVSEILAAIQVPCDNNRERRVCDRNEQCGKGYKCCWSGRYGAPGVCRKKGCGHIREEVRGRCDTKADCEYTSATEKCCFIHRSLTTFAGGRNRRGFCSASDECGGKKTSFDCGKGNACAGPSLNPNRQDLKCCQKLENTLDFSPKRMCSLNCNAPHRADVTNIERDHTALIPTIPLTKKKTDTTWFARSYNMMRFAQMATTLFNNADNFETFEAVQKKIELEQFCEKKHLKMQKTARTAALHITNSLLSVLSPYLLVELAYKPTSGEGEKEETFYNNFKALGNLNRVNLQTLSGDFHGNPDLAKRAIFYLLDFEGEPDPQNIRAEVNTLHTFLDQFTLEPKSDTEAGWFTRMTENFGRMKQEVKSVCDRYVRLEYRDDAGQTHYLLKKVDYARFAHWMENPADFENFLAIRSLKHAPADITPDGVARNIRTLKTQVTPSFEKGRACFTVWNKIVFGLHLLNEALEVKNGEFNKKLGILSETTNIVGTLASSVSFGGSAVAAKGINFCIKQAQKHVMTQTKANEALIEALLADFLAEPAKEHNKACSRFVAMANLAPSPRVYESLCPPMKLYPEALPAGPNEHVVSPSVVAYFQKQQLPKFLHEIVNSHCQKARVLHGALKTATAAETTAIKAAEPNAPAAVGAETEEQKAQRIAAFVDKDPQVVAARKAKAVPLNGLQRELNKVIGAYRQCSFNNDLESQFDAVEEIFKASLSMTSCDKLKNEHLVDAREYFTEKVVAVTHEERDLYDLYHNTLKEGAVLKVLEALVKIVGAVAEPLGARFMEMTFGHLAVFETAEQAILQGMARSGISVAPPVTQDQILELQAQINEIRGVGNGENR